MKRLGTLRSERNLQGDYAEWLAARMLGLRLAPSSVQRDYDGTDSEGRTYQVKSRIVQRLDRDTTSFDFRRGELSFHYLLCVFFSPTLELMGMVRIPCDAVRSLCSRTQSDLRFRWNKRSAGDPRMERLVWRVSEPDEVAPSGLDVAVPNGTRAAECP